MFWEGYIDHDYWRSMPAAKNGGFFYKGLLGIDNGSKNCIKPMIHVWELWAAIRDRLLTIE